MSPTSSLEHLYPVLRDADISFFTTCAATALAFYEHLITIRLEVQQIWNRDVSGATILFVMTRYFMLLDRMFVVIGLYPIQDAGRCARCCSAVLWLHAATTSILITVMSAIAAIRIFALWNRDYVLLFIVMLTGIFPAFANLFLRSASTVYIVPARFYTCQFAPTAVTAESYKACTSSDIPTTRVISIVSDGIVVVLTWVKTYRVYAITRRIRFRTDYSTLILRDGAVYFLATCVLNFVAIMYIWMTGTNLLNDLIVTLSAILMARFLLNLRDQRAQIEDMSFMWGDSGDSKLSLSQPVSSLRFASMSGLFDTMGTMGGTVSMGSQVDELDLSEDEEIEGLDSPVPPGSAGTSEATCVASDDHLHDKELQKIPAGASAWA
ncbi:hypothetical protein ONZ51_g6176 [Trametes cubensis]|uniref:DUF6533 domain-containing protein n=1 Tax=Trametes cubensis TaxID=1111947 RepID=A0AAD7TTR2_9APHY|nr:hypothetical protein ONZ51_g6176 [Trametes cubensis]